MAGKSNIPITKQEHDEIYREFAEIKKILQKHGRVNYNIVVCAFEYAKTAHESICQRRASGDPYITHPLFVAKVLAEMGFDNNVIAAAFLHDVVEDCKETGYTLEKLQETFNPEIVGIVDAVTAVEADEKSNLNKEEIDRQTIIKLFEVGSKYKYAFYIKLADRLHNLLTLDAMPFEKRVKKVRETRDVYLKLAQMLGTHYFTEKIQSLCFRIDQHDKYSLVCGAYSRLLEENRNGINEFKKIMESLKQENYVIDCVITERTPGNIYSHAIKHYPGEEHKYINKYRMPLLNVFIIIEEREYIYPLKMFMDIYKRRLHENEIIWVFMNEHPGTKGNEIILEDKYNNQYRIYVKTEKEYISYMNGSIDGIQLYSDADDISEALAPHITVYKRDDSPLILPEGSTVIDFAFAIHTQVGLYAKTATVNNVKAELHTKLHDGDKVVVIIDEESQHLRIPTVNPTWFRHVATKKAMDKLIEYITIQIAGAEKNKELLPTAALPTEL